MLVFNHFTKSFHIHLKKKSKLKVLNEILKKKKMFLYTLSNKMKWDKKLQENKKHKYNVEIEMKSVHHIESSNFMYVVILFMWCAGY